MLTHFFGFENGGKYVFSASEKRLKVFFSGFQKGGKDFLEAEKF